MHGLLTINKLNDLVVDNKKLLERTPPKSVFGPTGKPPVEVKPVK